MSAQGPEMRWQGTGDQQEVTEQRLAYAGDRLEQAQKYAVASETHLWLVMVSHLATDAVLDAMDGRVTAPMLDVDTMMGQPAAGCYVCEALYQPRLRRRKCPGPRL